MQSSYELEKLRSKIEELEEQIKKSPDLEERIVMRNLLLTLEQRVNFLMQGEQEHPMNPGRFKLLVNNFLYS